MQRILAKAGITLGGLALSSFAKDNDGQGSNPSNVYVGPWQSDGYMGSGSWNDLVSSIALY
ncbi:hypothetical protein ACWCQQ_22235 [Streptomyces sp. NPDC002143]